MQYTNITGALVEYIVRNLLKNCGFTNVQPDNIYTYRRGDTFFVNGKGAAHDADVLMNPPIQLPFTYPTQLLFECKAYKEDAKLSIIRNAYGLRNDLNEFEVITLNSIRRRQNNRRADYAIEDRRRYVFQVGVAVINGFTKPAFEFAANHKIPLLSLSWFLGPQIIQSFANINQSAIDGLPEAHVQNLYDFLKDRDGDLNSDLYRLARELLNANNILGHIVTFSNLTINSCFVGLLETGNMIFLFRTSENNILSNPERSSILTAEIHWDQRWPDIWTLNIYQAENEEQRSDYNFYLPLGIYKDWSDLNFDKAAALNIKGEFFSRIFVFNQRDNPKIPFTIVNINEEWLRELQYRIGENT